MTRNEADLFKRLNWSMPINLLVFGLTWGVLAGNIPPMAADSGSAAIASAFVEHRSLLKIAYGVAVVSPTLWITWSVALFGVMNEIGGTARIWAYLQLLAGALTGMVVTLACLFWLTAAFRPETDPAVVQLLNDLGWLAIDMPFGVTTLHFVSCAAAFLQDKRTTPLVPAWVAWFGVAVGLSYGAELAMPFYRAGALSWSGSVNYWIPFYVSFIWLIIVTYYIFRAIERLAQESAVVPSLGSKLP